MTESCVERRLELEAETGEVWAAIVDVETWLVDAGDLDLVSGSERVLVDDGVRRRAVVDEVIEGRRISYRWWTDGDSGGATGPVASRVEITLEPAGGATRVVVRETPLPVANARAGVAAAVSAARVRSGRWWEVRLACLAFTALAGRVAV